MKKLYDEPSLEIINFNVEENIMSISPRLGGTGGSGLVPDAEEEELEGTY